VQINTSVDNTVDSTKRERYRSLFTLIIAAGAIYPLLYLRQNFEGPLIDALGITLETLNEAGSILGIVFMLSYVPSGWLADRIDSIKLIIGSLIATGLLGLYFAQLPNPGVVKWIFAAWGITTGLTFWAALIKEVNQLAKHDEQGRFFGFLEGGRGLVEALLATAAVALFTSLLPGPESATREAMIAVIYFYSSMVLIIAGITALMIRGERKITDVMDAPQTSTFDAFKEVVRNPRIWLAIICVLTGYQFLWATYSFSGYLQTQWGMSASVAATLTLTKLWMRPIGAVTAGFLGDRFQVNRILSWSLLISSAATACLAFSPHFANATLILVILIGVGLGTYSSRGLYWAILDDCNIKARHKGLAIGFISLLAFTPEIYLPKLNSILLSIWPSGGGYAAYFGFVAGCGLAGALAAHRIAPATKL
jgi:MFS family permease